MLYVEVPVLTNVPMDSAEHLALIVLPQLFVHQATPCVPMARVVLETFPHVLLFMQLLVLAGYSVVPLANVYSLSMIVLHL
jgi:hypothetical protein